MAEPRKRAASKPNDKPTKNERYIWVCAECHQASCWAGIFMCEKSRTANLLVARRSYLVKLALEHTDYIDKPEVAATELDWLTRPRLEPARA